MGAIGCDRRSRYLHGVLQAANDRLAPGQLRLVRYAGVSVITLVVTQAVLLLGYGPLDLPGAPANMLAVSVGAIPSYLLNRAWVWERSGPHHLWREIVPFWVYAVLGLVVSTIVVAWADARWGTGLAASAANFGTYFVLWIAKFVFLDKLIFGPRTDDVPA